MHERFILEVGVFAAIVAVAEAASRLKRVESPVFSPGARMAMYLAALAVVLTVLHVPDARRPVAVMGIVLAAAVLALAAVVGLYYWRMIGGPNRAIRQACELTDQGRVEEAIDLLERRLAKGAAAEGVVAAGYLASIAQIHAGRKDWRAALESIDRALAADGELPGLYAGKAEILLQARGARAARDWLEPALPRFPSSAQVQTAWAEILVELGERDAAVAALESVECLLSTGQANDVLASHRAGWRELKLEPLREKLGRRT